MRVLGGILLLAAFLPVTVAAGAADLAAVLPPCAVRDIS